MNLWNMTKLQWKKKRTRQAKEKSIKSYKITNDVLNNEKLYDITNKCILAHWTLYFRQQNTP